MDNSIRFNRKPYQVVYTDFHTGELIKTKRRPPKKMHDILPTDIVELKHDKNVDWQEGDELHVKHIGYRAPNVLQLQNDHGETTFINHSDVELIEEVGYRRRGHLDDAQANRYLTWP